MKKPDIDQEAVYPAAERWVQAALRSDDSLFTPGAEIWSARWLGELRQRFIDHPDESSDRFEVKLQRQLAGAPAEVYQLMGEVLFIHLLVASRDSVSGGTKRSLISQVLGWSPAPVAVPPELDAALEHGLAATGIAFLTYRPFQVATIIRFVELWKSLPDSERTEALEDPWRFKAVLFRINERGAFAQREALLHFVHPDTFEAIISREQKAQIAKAFSHLVDESVTDVDQRILAMSEALSATYGDRFSWYQPDVRAIWQEDKSPWEQFVGWARLFFEDPGFDDKEITYKVRTAERVQEVRDVLDGDPLEAQARLKKALGYGNLVNWRSSDPYLEWVADNWEEARDGLRALWAEGDGAEERIRGFCDHLPQSAVKGVGTRLNIASTLLMANDPLMNPPYRWGAFFDSYKLTRSEGTPSKADEVITYRHALAFLERLSEECAARGLVLRHPLDAQSLVWCVAKGTLDDPKLQARLVKWRGDPTSEDEPEADAAVADGDPGRRAVVVYVGTAAMENFEFGLGNGVWGWKRQHEDYPLIRPGDVLVYGNGFTGGSPRTTPEEFAAHDLQPVVECAVTSTVTEETEPLWPDEVRAGSLVYPYRVRAGAPGELGMLAVADLNARYGADIGEALRMSAASGGRGVVVEIPSEAATVHEPEGTLADVCTAAGDAFKAAGLDYGSRHDDLVRSFIVSLATKRLVLLTGLSGSGKTRLGLAFGQWLGSDRYRVVAVRPDWTGPDALLGYENQLSAPVDDDYAWVVPDTLEFMLRAHDDPTNPYLLLLDEMNLAHVERYFADVLSGIESDEPILPDLEQKGGDWRPRSTGRLRFPKNLFVVGTVNIDETTYMFSPKVLDRANTIEFRVLTEDLQAGTGVSNVVVGKVGLVARFLEDASRTDGGDWDGQAQMASALTELHRHLCVIDREFGHRVFQEALRFGGLLARAGHDDWVTALDLQVMQKVLPRFHGSVKQIAEPLQMMGSWCFHGPGVGIVEGFDPLKPPEGDPALPDSFSKVARMYRRVLANHFVSFAE